jgi:hypothetical protein
MIGGMTVGRALGAGALAVIVVLAAWAWRLDQLRGGWKDRFDALAGQAGTVLVALRTASGNADLAWDGAAGQAIALGETNRSFRAAIVTQNRRIDEMAREAVRLKARADELARIADRARAARAAALARLGDMAATPGTRADCLALLREAEAALELVRAAAMETGA